MRCAKHFGFSISQVQPCHADAAKKIDFDGICMPKRKRLQCHCANSVAIFKKDLTSEGKICIINAIVCASAVYNYLSKPAKDFKKNAERLKSCKPIPFQFSLFNEHQLITACL
jgi:hypothetical protein